MQVLTKLSSGFKQEKFWKLQTGPDYRVSGLIQSGNWSLSNFCNADIISSQRVACQQYLDLQTRNDHYRSCEAATHECNSAYFHGKFIESFKTKLHILTFKTSETFYQTDLERWPDQPKAIDAEKDIDKYDDNDKWQSWRGCDIDTWMQFGLLSKQSHPSAEVARWKQQRQNKRITLGWHAPTISGKRPYLYFHRAH